MLRRLIAILLTLQVALLDAHFGWVSHGASPMALVLIEGFDLHTAAQATLRNWDRAFASMPAGRFGGQAARCTGNTTRFHKTLPSTYSTLTWGFALKSSVAGTAWGSNNAATFETAAGSIIASLRCDASGHPQILNSSATVIATGTTVIQASVWYYFEIKLVINGASGSCAMQLNGASEIGTTTGNFGSTNIGQIAGLGLGGNTDFDDMYACDTSGSVNTGFLGDVRVSTLVPTSDGAHTAWTPTGAGSHYTEVDDTTPDDDTTYISDSVVNDIDTFGCSDIDGGATVYGIQTNLYARKDDASTRQIAPVIRQSGTDYVGTTVTLSSTYTFYSQRYDQDPTSVNWTASNVNSDEYGVKEIA